MKKDIILSLYQSPKTIFSLEELSLMFPDISYANLKRRMSYYVSKGQIQKVRKDTYAKKDFNKYELANTLYTPSYISLETVLQMAGITFQYYETVFAITYTTRLVEVRDITIQYRGMKKDVLSNNEGIERKEGYFIATPERAFLDAIYIYKSYYFDNLRPLNWEWVMELKELYQNNAFNKRVEDYYQIYQSEHAPSN